MSWKTVFLIALAIGQVPAKSLISDAGNVKPDFIENIVGGESRIVSGWEAKPGEHPHHANLRLVDGNGMIGSCGGSLVHQDWVITAAHCTAQRVSATVRLGMVHLSQAGYVHDSREWYNYPTYQDAMANVVQVNDISILRLPTPAIFSSVLQPIRIQPRADTNRNYAGSTFLASGHGRTWTGGATTNSLQWVYLTAISNNDCFRTFGSIITDNSICARFFNVTSQSTCHGDSGGPLVHVDNGRPTLVGVTSFVAGAESGGCHSGFPAGFIRPGPFHSWFTSVTGIDFDNVDIPTTATPETTIPWQTTTTWSTTTSTPWPTTTPQPDTTTYLPTTPEEEPEPEEPEPEEPEPEEPESESEEDSESQEDPELSELLKKLEVKVKVNVKMSKYGSHKEIHHNHTVSHHHRRRHHH